MFAVLNNRWKMLREMHSFPLEKQVKIVIASMALHNFIRINARTNMDLNHMMMIKGYFHLMKKRVEWSHLLRKMVHIMQEGLEEEPDQIANLLLFH